MLYRVFAILLLVVLYFAGCAHNRDKNVYTKTTTYNIINATRINIQTINYQQPEIRKVKSNDSTFTYENGILKSIKTKTESQRSMVEFYKSGHVRSIRHDSARKISEHIFYESGKIEVIRGTDFVRDYDFGIHFSENGKILDDYYSIDRISLHRYFREDGTIREESIICFICESNVGYYRTYDENGKIQFQDEYPYTRWYEPSGKLIKEILDNDYKSPDTSNGENAREKSFRELKSIADTSSIIKKYWKPVPQKFFYPSGALKSVRLYQNDSLYETSYYESGTIQRTVKGDTVKGFYESGALQYRFVNEVSYHSFYESGKPKTEEFAVNAKFRTMRHFLPDGRHDYDAILGNVQGPQFKRVYFESGGVQEEYSCYHQRHYYPSGNLKFAVDYTDSTATYILYLDQATDPQNPDANVKEKIVKSAGEGDTNLGSVATEPSDAAAETTSKTADETGAPKIKPFVPEQYQATCRELENLLAENPAAQKFLDQ